MVECKCKVFGEGKCITSCDGDADGIAIAKAKELARLWRDIARRAGQGKEEAKQKVY